MARMGISILSVAYKFVICRNSKVCSNKKILQLYAPYHEMDIRQFVDKMNELYLEAKKETNLKIRRNELGVSQSKLAELTDVPVRTIQQYEQRQKNINKEQAEYLVGLLPLPASLNR